MGRVWCVILLGVGLVLVGCSKKPSSWNRLGMSPEQVKAAEEACWHHVLHTESGQNLAEAYRKKRWRDDAATGLVTGGIIGVIAAPIGTGLGLALERQIAGDDPKVLQHNAKAFNSCMQSKGYRFS